MANRKRLRDQDREHLRRCERPERKMHEAKRTTETLMVETRTKVKRPDTEPHCKRLNRRMKYMLCLFRKFL